MENTNEELNVLLEQATADFNRIGAQLDRLQELQEQGQGDSKEAVEIARSLLE